MNSSSLFSARRPAWMALAVAVLACSDEPANPPPNRAPATVGAITDRRLALAERVTVDVAQYFSDPDGDDLTYSAAASPGGIVGLSVAGSEVAIEALAVGRPTVTVTATDAGGLSASQAFTVTVVTSSGDRSALTALYRATGGADAWADKSNWLTASDLGEWYGVATDGAGRVTALDLPQNGLSGELPPELGELSRLRRFNAFWNHVRGPIPVKLGRLSELAELDLSYTYMTGSIPSEIGDLGSLRTLRLGWSLLTGTLPASLGNLSSLEELSIPNSHWSERGITGPIPPELGNLARLRILNLGMNGLSGRVPPELGSLTRLDTLDLGMNELSGPIPPELGSLVGLKQLWLQKNKLSGEFPAELARLSGLEELYVSGNPELRGELPAGLVRLRSLDAFIADGTGLCAPADATFTDWLNRIPKRRVARCGADAVTAYLTQAVQSRGFPVPLVAADSALLRVFVTGEGATGSNIPPVRASFYDAGGAMVHVATIAGSERGIPDSVAEGDLAASSNAVIPGRVVRPGLEMVVEVDPDGTLDSSVDVTRRIPAEGRLKLDVVEMPRLEVTVIPMLWAESPDSTILDLTDGMTAEDTLFWKTRDLMPVGDMRVTVHDPVVSDDNDIEVLFRLIATIRAAEGGTDHYLGMMMQDQISGIAELAGPVAFSGPDPHVIAHEFGHNFNLRHAPCGGAAGADAAFPTDDAAIGVWGFDLVGDTLVAPTLKDMMSYCKPAWIGDFHFTNALRFRVDDASASRAAAPAERVLLLSGGVDAYGNPALESALAIDAPPSLPRYDGAHRITGRDADGAPLFSLRFGMPEVADGDGGSSFSFAVPVADEWAGTLASITLSGNGRSDTIDRNTDRPLAILRDPLTGQVRRVLRELPGGPAGAAAAAGLAADAGLEVIFSRGIPAEGDLRR